MVIVKSRIACKFVNLLNRQIKSPHFQIFVTNLQVDLDFITPTLEVSSTAEWQAVGLAAGAEACGRAEQVRGRK